MLSVDDLKEVVTGALSTVLSRTSSDAVAQGSSAQSSSQARGSTLTPQLVRTQRVHNELEDDEVPPLPPPLPILKKTSTK